MLGVQHRHGPAACSPSASSPALLAVRWRRSPGWAGEGGQTHRRCPPCLLMSSCKRSGTSLRAAFLRKASHPKTSPGLLPACKLPEKEQAALQAAGQLCPPLSDPGAKPEPPHSLHACPQLATQLGQELLMLVPSTFITNPKLAKAVLGKCLTWLQKSSRVERAAGQQRSIPELGASPGWVQGHKHHCGMARVALGTGSSLGARATLQKASPVTTARSQLSPRPTRSDAAADGKHGKPVALDLSSSLTPLPTLSPSRAPSPRHARCPKEPCALQRAERGRQKTKPASAGVS